jgi:hypothetical protein
MQVLLDEKLTAAGKPLVAVGALLFAPPNVGSDAVVAAYNKRVNARRCAAAGFAGVLCWWLAEATTSQRLDGTTVLTSSCSDDVQRPG